MPPPPTGFGVGVAPRPRGPMLPEHAAPNRATKTSPAGPRACCCAPRGPSSRREHDGGSLVQLMGLFLSKSPQPVQQPGDRESSEREWTCHQLVGNRPWSETVATGTARSRHLFVKILVTIEQRGDQGDFLTRTEGEMPNALTAFSCGCFASPVRPRVRQLQRNGFPPTPTARAAIATNAVLTRWRPALRRLIHRP